MDKKDMWIAGITRGHNGGVCLLHNGEIVFSIEEERISRNKYDGSPYAGIFKILEYTDKLDYVGFAHTQSLDGSNGPECRTEFTQENVYLSMLRKLGLLQKHPYNVMDPASHPQVIDLSHDHHKLHAWCGFVRSGWDDATVLVVDGAGTFIPMTHQYDDFMTWEVESVFSANKKTHNKITTVFKHIATKNAIPGYYDKMDTKVLTHLRHTEEDAEFTTLISDRAGTVKAYEAVTALCGWQPIEAGKTMGLAPYGNPNDDLMDFYDRYFDKWPITNRNWVVPTYPNGAKINDILYIDDSEYFHLFEQGKDCEVPYVKDIAYKLQEQTQDAVLQMIEKSVELTGNKKVIVTGGYGLNCVANYHYLDRLNELGIELYVEPISNDAGTALGAAYWVHQLVTGETKTIDKTLYLGPAYCYSKEEIDNLADKYNASITNDVTNEDVIDIITDKNIVTLFQGRCENGPRALGNRSILYDPTDPNGKDFVNNVKRREYFRPFAGSILKEDVHEWFDLRGMTETPHMMYAVNCQPGIEEKIPSIIHVDGTCRIQTVTEEQNPNYYSLIKAFKEKTGCPIIFNTSFNLGGEPLVETLDDGFRTLANSDIEYMYLPEYKKLVYIKNHEIQ